MTNSLQETISRLKDLNYEEDEAMENCKALDHAILVLQRVLDAEKNIRKFDINKVDVKYGYQEWHRQESWNNCREFFINYLNGDKK